jgi:hypothetical protein
MDDLVLIVAPGGLWSPIPFGTMFFALWIVGEIYFELNFDICGFLMILLCIGVQVE